MIHSPPDPDVLEVSVFGPGIGEALAIHIGGGSWILVDSCIEPNATLPAQLHYLHTLNVDVNKSVLFIIATHWHNDHIRGLSTALEQCGSCSFVISRSLRSNEFLELVSLYRATAIQKTPATNEISKVFEILHSRKQFNRSFPVLASSNQIIFREPLQLPFSVIEAILYSLSPSEVSILKSMSEFCKWLEEGKPQKIMPPSNEPSVALLLEIDDQFILLGADLEHTNDPETGWSAILSKSNIKFGKAQIFKIPHHGSENAHHQGIWDSLLAKDPVAVVTPYGRGKKPLPSPADIFRISGLTSNGFATAPTKRKRVRFQERSTARTFNAVTKSAYSIQKHFGHVRLRKKIGKINDEWKVELFGEAYPLRPDLPPTN